MEQITDTDRQLREAGNPQALAAHRWHWTLDASNPAAMSLLRYARATRQPLRDIRADAHAHQARKAEKATPTGKQKKPSTKN